MTCDKPKPGPGYWDWRCLKCDQPVDDHPSAWQRFKRKALGWLGR